MYFAVYSAMRLVLGRGVANDLVVHVGDVHHVVHLIAAAQQPAAQNVLESEGPQVADVRRSCRPWGRRCTCARCCLRSGVKRLHLLGKSVVETKSHSRGNLPWYRVWRSTRACRGDNRVDALPQTTTALLGGLFLLRFGFHGPHHAQRIAAVDFADVLGRVAFFEQRAREVGEFRNVFQPGGRAEDAVEVAPDPGRVDTARSSRCDRCAPPRRRASRAELSSYTRRWWRPRRARPAACCPARSWPPRPISPTESRS